MIGLGMVLGIDFLRNRIVFLLGLPRLKPELVLFVLTSRATLSPVLAMKKSARLRLADEGLYSVRMSAVGSLDRRGDDRVER